MNALRPIAVGRLVHAILSRIDLQRLFDITLVSTSKVATDMGIRSSGKALTHCALKVLAGSVLAFAVLLHGVHLGGCPPGTFCFSSVEFYSMQLSPRSGLAVLLSLCLLLSALKDLLADLGHIKLVERNIESIADVD